MKKFEADSLELVYDLAKQEFECSITELVIEVIQQPTNGFLGFGKKKAIICAYKQEKSNSSQKDSETRTYKNKDVKIEDVTSKIENSKIDDKVSIEEEPKETLVNVPKVESKEQIFDNFYGEEKNEVSKIFIKKDKDIVLKE